MYFRHENGSYKRVPIYPNAQLGIFARLHTSKRSVTLTCLGYDGQNADHIKGGMTIYYTQKDFESSDLGNPVTAFPPVSNAIRSVVSAGQRLTRPRASG
jgi:hypothetical protein